MTRKPHSDITQRPPLRQLVRKPSDKTDLSDRREVFDPFGYEKNKDRKVNSVILNDIDPEKQKILLERLKLADNPQPYSPKGRKLRKAFERPRPDLPPSAPANRQKKQVALSLPVPLLDELNAAARNEGIDRNAFIERAIRAALALKM